MPAPPPDSGDCPGSHGCRVSPRTGLREAPSASMPGRLGKLLDPDELEAALTATVAAAALDPAVPAAYAAHRAGQQREREERRKKRKQKAHMLAAVTHLPGLVIAQDKVARRGKANEISHFKPLLAPLPLAGAVVTSDAMQANRDNALFLREAKDAHWPWPILGNQPTPNQALNALPWEDTPVSAATSEITRGRIETRTIRVLPAPDGTGFAGAARALLIERYVTYKKKGQWHTRAEAVLYLTSLAPDDAAPEDLLAFVRGHWRVEHTHWQGDVIWKEDKSLIRTGNGPQVWSALANLVITLFRIHGVTSFAAETRRIARFPGSPVPRFPDAQIEHLDKLIVPLVAARAPGLLGLHGVGPDTAALLLIAAGDHPGRLRSEAARAHLCGAAPIPASSGKVTRWRLNRGGNRDASHALWQIVIPFHGPADLVT